MSAGLCGCHISFQEREPMCGDGENGIGKKERRLKYKPKGREGRR